MNHDIVYVLHKNGAQSHYLALDFLLKKNGLQLRHREFPTISRLFKSIIKFDIKSFSRQLTNIAFLIHLLATKKEKVILGIAPFDYKLKNFLFYLKRHKIYYHTSWTCWDKTFHPKTKKNNSKTFRIWKKFIEKQVLRIYAVTEQSKKQLLENYDIPESKIDVVKHSVDPVFLKDFDTIKEVNSFVYFGRLVPQKGLKEILEYFKTIENATFTIIGDGKEKPLVLEFAKKYPSIIYKEFLNSKIELAKEISKKQYLILNSKRNHKWEELFGLAIIESMAQGLIPISSNHSGPKEIINKDIGYLYEEGDVTTVLDLVLSENHYNTNQSLKAKEQAKQYLPHNIADQWKSILK